MALNSYVIATYAIARFRNVAQNSHVIGATYANDSLDVGFGQDNILIDRFVKHTHGVQIGSTQRNASLSFCRTQSISSGGTQHDVSSSQC